jgi:YD repeat-containing protein
MPVQKTARQTNERLSSRAEQAIRVGQPGPNATVARTVYETDGRHAYTAEYFAQGQSSRQDVPAGSTWEQQPVSAPQPQAIAPSQPHNYYPNMRSGMTAQQPVTLTANRNFYYPGCHCTPSRAHALGGGGHR